MHRIHLLSSKSQIGSEDLRDNAIIVATDPVVVVDH